jgi:hypothetical protein
MARQGRGVTFTIAWLIWILQFVAIEGVALCNKQPGDTLSEHVWDWASIKDKGAGWRLRRVGLLMFLAWLVAHFLTGGEF